MGTRGAFGFRVNGNDKITYNHCASYPDGLGADLVAFIRDTPMDEMRQIAERIVMVEPKSTPTQEQIEECRRWADLGVGRQTLTDWYCLLRKAQGDLSPYKDGLRYMIDSVNFLGGSLFCEWAYVLNVDTCRFEVYRGFQKEPQDNRYRHLARPDESFGYCQVALVAEFPLEDIPANWFEALFPPDEDAG